MSDDAAAMKAVMALWGRDQNRRTGDPEYLEQWYDQQCGSCAHWFPLAGTLGADYGVCGNPESAFGARLRFEHDGCEGYRDAGRWTLAEDMP